jgi:hypothetical protein
MGYYSIEKEIKETDYNKTVAVATHEVGAEIIVKALNYYFGDTVTGNQAVEMMNKNTAFALKKIADFVIKNGYDSEQITEYLMEISEEMEAQALVVSMRDELKFDKPKQG